MRVSGGSSYPLTVLKYTPAAPDPLETAVLTQMVQDPRVANEKLKALFEQSPEGKALWQAMAQQEAHTTQLQIGNTPYNVIFSPKFNTLDFEDALCQEACRNQNTLVLGKKSNTPIYLHRAYDDGVLARALSQKGIALESPLKYSDFKTLGIEPATL